MANEMKEKTIEKGEDCLPDGKSYRHCIAWRVHGGCGNACFDMCSSEQRAACKEQHTMDKTNNHGDGQEE